MERTQENLDRLTERIADAQLDARQMGLDALAESLAALARDSALVAAIERPEPR